MTALDGTYDDVLPVLYADDRRYVTTRKMGEGSTARIYLATDPDGVQVAVKVLKKDSAIRPRAFMREADRLQALRRKECELFADRPYSTFPEVLDRDPAECFFVAEVALGRPLSRVFSQRQILRPDQAVTIAISIGEALQVVAALGLRNRDLKSDAIFWEPSTGRVVVVDWNVVGQARDAQDMWLSTDVRVTASFLDALLAGGEHVAEWSAPFTTPPDRWMRYYRALRLALEDLLRFPAEVDLDGFLSTLRAVGSMLADRPDQLLDFVTKCLLDARQEVSDEARVGLAEQALAATEIGLDTDHGPTLMRGRALLGQAEDIREEGAIIKRLWSAISDADGEGSFEAGETLESLRLRVLAAFARRAPGYVDEARGIALHFARLEWQLALAGITSLAKRLEPHSEVHTLLLGLEPEVRGLSGAFVALQALESGEDDRARAQLADGLTALANARHAELLLARFEHLRTVFDALEPTPEAPQIDEVTVGLAVLRRQFATQGSVDPDALLSLGESESLQVFRELICAWDEVDQSGGKDTGETLVSSLVYALKMSAGQNGSIPLARALPALGRVATGFESRIGGVNLEDARSAVSDAAHLEEALLGLETSLGESDHSEEWLEEAGSFVAGWITRAADLTRRTDEALQSLTLYRHGLAQLGENPPLSQRAELLLRLERRRPEDRTIGELLVGARRRLEEALRAGRRTPDILAARGLLFPQSAKEPTPAPAPLPREERSPPSRERPDKPSIPVTSARRRPAPETTTERRPRPGDTSWVTVSVLAAASVIVLAFHWAANRSPAERSASRGISSAELKSPLKATHTARTASSTTRPHTKPLPTPPPSAPRVPTPSSRAMVDAPPAPQAPVVEAPAAEVLVVPPAPTTGPPVLSPSPAPRQPEVLVQPPAPSTPPPVVPTAAPESKPIQPVAAKVPPATRPAKKERRVPRPASKARRVAQSKSKGRSTPKRQPPATEAPDSGEASTDRARRFATTAKDRAAIQMARDRARALKEKLNRQARKPATPPKPVAKPKAKPRSSTKKAAPPAKTTVSPGYLTDDW